MLSQISLFDGNHPFINDKPIRLIELFGGYGSQALALKYLGVPFEHWRLSEWAIKSIQAYKDLHAADDNIDYSQGKTVDEIRYWLLGRISSDYNKPLSERTISRLSEKKARTIYNNMQATRNVGSITHISAADLAVVDTDKYCYIMTYSFPCQDLSMAGQGKGMSKGSGTRSGLLWEVERLLGEMPERPQVLLMENVPQVVGKKGIKDFALWSKCLEEFGYTNYWKCLNAKDFGIPHNRNRCFMISLLGDYGFMYPKPQPLTVRLKDLLEKKVDEKYFLSDKTIKMFIEQTRRQQENGNGFKFEPTFREKSVKCVLTRAGERPCDNFIVEARCEHVGQIVGKGFNDMIGRVYGTDGLSPTIRTMVGGNNEPKIAETITYDDYNGRIRADQDCIGTLTTNCGSCARRNGVKIIVPQATQKGYDIATYGDSINTAYPNSTTRRGRVGHGVAQTLTTGDAQQVVIEPRICAIRGRNPDNPSDRTTGNPTQQRLEIGSEMTSNTLTTVQKDNLVVEPTCRIRKLTERECFRLMGVKDEDFEKIVKNQSPSSLYHLAGDSIVTAVLIAIFGELFGISNYGEKIETLVNEVKEDRQ